MAELGANVSALVAWSIVAVNGYGWLRTIAIINVILGALGALAALVVMVSS